MPDQQANEQLQSVTGKLDGNHFFVGDTIKIIPTNTLSSGRIISNAIVQTSYISETPAILSIDHDNATALSEGMGRIRITSSYNETQVVGYLDVEVLPESALEVEVTAGGSEYIKQNDPNCRLLVNDVSESEETFDITGSVVSYVSLSPEVASIDASGLITQLEIGDAKFKIVVDINGRIEEVEKTLPIIVGKNEPSLYTYEKRENILENGSLYPWAASAINSTIIAADRYLVYENKLWDMVPSEGIPRAIFVGMADDPEVIICRYCKTDLRAKYGNYPWISDAFNDPFKIKCPECNRRFPSNDFASYYKLGLDDYGAFDPALAKQKNDALIASGKPGYLVNILYPEMGEGWGVDDGFGYIPKDANGQSKVYPNGCPEKHTYIAYYMHWGIWDKGLSAMGNGAVMDTLRTLSNAYVYSGDPRYGRAGAILLDRIADFYPDYHYALGSATTGRYNGGKTLDYIWECGQAESLASAYDMLYPIFDDPYVVNYLNTKSKQVKMTHAKTNSVQIRNNIEDGILRTIYKGAVEGDILGNFGYHQAAVATAAVVLDTMPETAEWLDWMMADGDRVVPITGGNVASQLVDVIDRDGMGNEASGYNVGWLTSLIKVAEILKDYDGYTEANLYAHPKFKNMFTSLVPLVAGGYYSPQIGDSAATASSGIWMTLDIAMKGFINFGDHKFAKLAYLLNDNNVNGMKLSIMDANPEEIKTQISNIIEAEGTLDLESDMMTGFGFAILRDGAEGIALNNTRDFWMYFGKNGGHGHYDTLNLGISAFGLNMAPDLGYPEDTGTQPNRLQWVEQPISHNTVVVDGTTQNYPNDNGNGGYPMHFDDSGKVKLFDVDAPNQYNSTQTYRRTLVMVEASDDVSYGVDFFRIIGGNSHLYSFHSQSDEIFETQGLDLTAQVDGGGNYIGSYAGANVPYGPDPNSPAAWWYNTVYPRGYTWTHTVDRDTTGATNFAVDFKVKDFNQILTDSSGLHLRMTMLSDTAFSEVATVNGCTPKKAANINVPDLKYVFVKRNGTNLDSLFTTVYEPYKNSRYIQNIEAVSMQVTSGTPQSKDIAKAVKVTLSGNRVDYIIYATNNSVTYQVDNLFNFRGFVGVYSIVNGVPTLKYINDGDILAGSMGTIPAVTGTISDFTRELAGSNKIIITPSESVDLASLAGKYIYVSNDKVQNGAYKIIDAIQAPDGKIELNIGDVSVIRGYSKVTGETYVYNIAPNQTFRIPLPYVSVQE